MRVRRSARSIEPSNSAMLAITTAANNYIFLVFANCTHVGNDVLLLLSSTSLKWIYPFSNATLRPTKAFGSSARSPPGTSGHGRLRPKRDIDFRRFGLKPRFSVKADISSGDNPSSRTLRTFDPLFPKGNYFGVLATTGPGPINFIDVHPHIETTFPHNVTASFDWIFQCRENVLDGVYSVQGFPIRPQTIAKRDLSETGRARSCNGRLTDTLVSG